MYYQHKYTQLYKELYLLLDSTQIDIRCNNLTEYIN
jgi:hypothetical protein